VFVYITATWPSQNASAPPNKQIIWDAILPSRLEPWHQNQYIHPTAAPTIKGKRRRASSSSTRIYADTDIPGKLKLKGQKPKYVITDPSGFVAGAQGAKLELRWNTQPWVGILGWGWPWDLGVWKQLVGGKSETFDFPEIKGSEKPKGMDTVRGGEGNRGKPA
jgi:signal peptidase complex subunit 3